VGNGHELYWVDWGNQDIKNPIFTCTGDRGKALASGHSTSSTRPRQRVVFHDQRGSGRSTPFASTKHNTTADLLSDINQLKQHLGFETVFSIRKFLGSTLSLLYAIANPGAVEKNAHRGNFPGPRCRR